MGDFIEGGRSVSVDRAGRSPETRRGIEIEAGVAPLKEDYAEIYDALTGGTQAYRERFNEWSEGRISSDSEPSAGR